MNQNVPRKEIVEFLKSNYSVSQKTIDTDFTAVNKILKNTVKYESDALKTLLNDKYDDLYKRALSKNDLGNAIKVLDQMSKLNGMYTERKEIDIKDNSFEIVLK